MYKNRPRFMIQQNYLNKFYGGGDRSSSDGYIFNDGCLKYIHVTTKY